jgi:hypothetical protein
VGKAERATRGGDLIDTALSVVRDCDCDIDAAHCIASSCSFEP